MVIFPVFMPSFTSIAKRVAPHIKLVEVGPRDGLQNERKILSVQQRITLIHNLQSSGFNNIEVGSFVNPKAVPQMANTDLVLKGLQKNDYVQYSALVPNEKGYENIPENSDLDEVVFFIAASETFNKKNIGCSIEESLKKYEALAHKAAIDGRKIRLSISCCWGCPYEGTTNPQTILKIIKHLDVCGVHTFDLADTIGVANSSGTARLIDWIKKDFPISRIACHFHDSKGNAVSNIEAAIQSGCTTFHSSINGIGGCPFSPNRVGNVATEKVLDLLDNLNVTYDPIDRIKLSATSKWLQKQLVD